MSLRHLNDEVRVKVRSCAMIHSVCGCVRELVYNSLDAGATHIMVKLDINKYFVQVIDNGCGINREDMIVLGRQGFTSKLHKCEDLDTISSMGFRGEALFSMCELTGTIEVCSRHQLSSETWSKLFHHGRDLGVTRSTHWKSVGTSITLRDMFFNLPVRRKCIKESLEVEHIRQMMQQTALANPLISFVVERDATGTVIVKCKKVQSMLERISHFYSHSIAKSMRSIGHRAGRYHVSGYVSTELSSNKSLQLVYINRRLVWQNQIHVLLDNLLVRQMCPKAKTERFYPQYLITIHCPPSDYDFCYQPSKTLVEFVDWPAVLKATAGAVNNVVLSDFDDVPESTSNEDDNTNTDDGVTSHEMTSIHFSHGMQSKKVQRTVRTTATLINDTLTYDDSNSSQKLDDIAHKFIGVKTVSRSPLHTSSIAQKLTQFSNDRKPTPEYSCSFKPPKYPASDLLISPFIPLDHSTPLQILGSNDVNTTDAPSSTRTVNKSHVSLQYHHDSGRTSDHVPHPKLLLAAPHLSHGTTPFISGKRMSLSLSANNDSKQLPCSNSVERLLSEWNNPVFKTGQEHIMTASQCCTIPFRLQSMTHHYQFTKQMFENIRVINQVDNKFIACLMDTKCSGSHNLLVLVDQHAAHERVRMEQLTAELYSEGEVYGNHVSGCQIQTSAIEPTVKIYSNHNILSAVATFHAQLKTVGIDLSEVNGSVIVNKLPSVLVNNGVPIVSTTTIKEMITEHIEHLSNTTGASHTIPRVLTNILATQACHGAIKFNDPLTRNECQKLMELLSQCKLPFQCAHGRPSLIPLLDISSLNKTIS